MIELLIDYGGVMFNLLKVVIFIHFFAFGNTFAESFKSDDIYFYCSFQNNRADCRVPKTNKNVTVVSEKYFINGKSLGFEEMNNEILPAGKRSLKFDIDLSDGKKISGEVSGFVKESLATLILNNEKTMKKDGHASFSLKGGKFKGEYKGGEFSIFDGHFDISPEGSGDNSYSAKLYDETETSFKVNYKEFSSVFGHKDFYFTAYDSLGGIIEYDLPFWRGRKFSELEVDFYCTRENKNIHCGDLVDYDRFNNDGFVHFWNILGDKKVSGHSVTFDGSSGNFNIKYSIMSPSGKIKSKSVVFSDDCKKDKKECFSSGRTRLVGRKENY